MQYESLLTACDREPVATPGAIQPFGALVVVRPSDLQIVQVSQNCKEILGLDVASLLGQPLDSTLGADCAKALRNGAVEFRNERFSALFRRNKSVYLIELETSVPPPHSRPEQRHLDLLQDSTTLQELMNHAVKAIADLTGLDRVMAYRFHPDLHGEVIAEQARPGLDPFLGLHYPATDIPVPARAVFLQNWVRMVPDVSAAPVPLEPVLNPLTEQPLDLGHSLLRAVSPVHIQYLKNMNVSATLTLSLINRGQLWGLIACHSQTPKYLTAPVRDACEAVARMTSAHISLTDDLEAHRARDKYLATYTLLKERIQSAQDISAELLDHSPNLLDLITAQGSSAALYLDGFWRSTGETPPEPELNRLVSWLAVEHTNEPVFATDHLGAIYPPALEWEPAICGLLAVSVPKSSRNYILWFRPEQIRTVNWAGKPEKIPDSAGRLHPRASFQEWSETVSGRSSPWTASELEAAMQLRGGIMTVDLQRQYEKEQEARAEAERAAIAREELMAILSHDLKNSIGSIKLGAKVGIKLMEKASYQQVKDGFNRIDRAASNMDALINDILSVTKLEAGLFEVEPTRMPINAVAQEVIDILFPLAAEKDITLGWSHLPEDCYCLVDAPRMFQAISNIVGNAIKFTPNFGRVTLSMDSCGPEMVRLTITDTGPGIPAENLPHIFDRFWQAQHARRLGTGLGLAIAKAIVVAHQGTIEVKSDGKNGTQFVIELPPLPSIPIEETET